MSITAPSVLPGNILTKADSDFESGTPTWAALTNATTPTVTTSYAFTGTHSLTWQSSASGDVYIQTGYYPCAFVLGSGYDFSCYVNTITAVHDIYLGVSWYNSSHTQIGSTMFDSDCPSVQTGVFMPVIAGLTPPSGAAYLQMVLWISTNVQASEVFALDLAYVTNCTAQVLVDWWNPAFSQSSMAGNAFADMTPWVRFDETITLSRGRQDAISEIQSGQATFSLQNDSGWFTPQNSASPFYPNVSLGERVQINVPDQTGNWVTRFDGAIAEVTYTIDPTGDTNLANVACSDVLAFMNRQDAMSCWTIATIKNDGPWLFWPLNDKGDTIVAAEMSGNNGPPLRLYDSGTSSAAVSWQNTNGGVETLADAAAAAASDGSEYWTPGSDVPSTLVRGLDSGTVGPVTSTLGSVYFTPVLTTQAGTNYFVGTDGYQLNGELYINGQPQFINPNVTGNNYSIECWFMMDPAIRSNETKNLGPYTILSLGCSRQASCVDFGVYYASSVPEFMLATYSQPPAYGMSQYSVVPSPTVYSTSPITQTEAHPLPHHLVLEITGASSGGYTINVWIDGVNTITLSSIGGNPVFDTLCIGGAFGGHGNFYGNISCVSIYQYLLSQGQINLHCAAGQYGYWEQTTDNCVGALADFAGVPMFWNNLPLGPSDGLTLTEYYDITGNTPLANMQVYEQAERGLLYVNSSGQITFHTRDWRMGYGAPDVALQSSIYNADLGYELIDTFLLNEAAVNTNVFVTGVDWVNSSSGNSYGTYSNGTQTSPVSLPLITWSRGYAVLGLSQYGYWPDPALNDNVAWQVNTRSSPRLVCGQLTIDVLTFEPGISAGVQIANLLALDIDNMVTLAGLPASFPNQSGAMDFFIEGVDETIGLGTHTLTFYTSPASIQRAWRPGDSTYGVLGSTSRIGISGPDVSIPPALGKTVAHDAGAPYWPPAFATQLAAFQLGWNTVTGTNPTITCGKANGTENDCVLVEVLAAAAATISSVSDTQSNTYALIGSVTFSTHVQYLYAATLSNNSNGVQPLNSSDVITVNTTTSQQYTLSAYGINGVSGTATTAVTSTGTSASPSVSVGTLPVGNELELVIVSNANSAATNLPSGWTWVGYNVYSPYDNQIFWKQATSTTGDTFSASYSASQTWGAIAIAFTLNTYTPTNNPAQNGHNFVGATDIRGLHDTVATALTPPLCVVGCVSHSSTYQTGDSNGIANHATWDTVWVDTVGGMGVVPGYPNWYCCLVPGYYEIDASFVWSTQSSGATGIRTAWIIVAQAGAQAIANGAANLTSVSYVCPVGEQVGPNNNSLQPIDAPVTRLYLGVGDMVAIGCMHTQGANLASSNAMYSMMSVRWLGYNTGSDQTPLAGTPGGGSSSNPPPKGGGGTGGGGTSTHTQSWYPTSTYSYWGTSSSWSPQLRYTNGLLYQGEYAGGSAAGSQFSVIEFNYNLIKTAITGATVKSATLTMHNQHSWWDSGVTLLIGWSTNVTFGSSFNPNTSATHMNCQQVGFGEGQTKTFNLDLSIVKQFANSATSLVFGNNSTTNLSYYGYWTGGSYPKLTITYSK